MSSRSVTEAGSTIASHLILYVASTGDGPGADSCDSGHAGRSQWPTGWSQHPVALARGGPRQLSRKHLRSPRSQPRLSIAPVNTRFPQPAAERRGHRPPSSLQRRSPGHHQGPAQAHPAGHLARRTPLRAARAHAGEPVPSFCVRRALESEPAGPSQEPDNRASPQLIAPYRQFRGVGRVGLEPTTGGL